MQTAELKVQRVTEDAKLPQYQTDGAACFDLHASGEGWHINALAYGATVRPGASQSFRTGLKFEVPAGHVMLIYSRSGHGFKNHVRLANCVGVIDSDYRGEVMVKLMADGKFGDLTVRPGDRIAQAMLVPLPFVRITEVAGLSETERGERGFGSTGQ